VSFHSDSLKRKRGKNTKKNIQIVFQASAYSKIPLTKENFAMKMRSRIIEH
jgi:hypothetical protein